MYNDIQDLIPKFRTIGLELNPRKCEFSQLGSRNPPNLLTAFNNLLPGLHMRTATDLLHLNAPIAEEAIPIALEKAKSLIWNICQRIKVLDSHTALFLLTHYTAAPRLIYLLRSAPLFKAKEELASIDDTLRDSLCSITNVRIDDGALGSSVSSREIWGFGLAFHL